MMRLAIAVILILGLGSCASHPVHVYGTENSTSVGEVSLNRFWFRLGSIDFESATANQETHFFLEEGRYQLSINLVKESLLNKSKYPNWVESYREICLEVSSGNVYEINGKSKGTDWWLILLENGETKYFKSQC